MTKQERKYAKAKWRAKWGERERDGLAGVNGIRLGLEILSQTIKDANWKPPNQGNKKMVFSLNMSL